MMSQTSGRWTKPHQKQLLAVPRSPKCSRKFSDVTSVLKEEKQQHSDDNPYYCPDMIEYLMDNYMAIYPLWRGALLAKSEKIFQ